MDKNGAQELLPGEHVVTSNEILTLTNYRVFRDAAATGGSRYVSISLDAISSCGLVTGSQPILLVLGIIAALGAFVLKGDAATINQMRIDPKMMQVAHGMFQSTCSACHAKDGGGINGVNLTDNHYKNIKALPDLFTVISNGAANGAMPSWRNSIQQNQRVLLAAYVANLRGTTPAKPKARPSQVRPLRRSRSKRARPRGTRPLRMAATPLLTKVSAQATRVLPPASRKTPTSAR